MTFKHLDFSEYHPLDHGPWSRRCRALPGGIRRHLTLAWEYRWRDRIRWPWQRLIMCPLGRHDTRVWWRLNDGNPVARVRCEFCPLSREATPAELADQPPFL